MKTKLFVILFFAANIFFYAHTPLGFGNQDSETNSQEQDNIERLRGMAPVKTDRTLLDDNSPEKKSGNAKPANANKETNNHPATADEIIARFSNPETSLEQAISELLFLIANQMDKKIEDQAQKVSALNQGSHGVGRSAAADLEAVKLKQLVESRKHLFDIFRQIVDRYNETAKNAVQSLRQ